MDKKFAMKWARALESGKYGQTREKLFNGRNYCCLGVACLLAGFKFEKIHSRYECQGEAKLLPLEVIEAIGIKNSGGIFNYNNIKTSLATLNDERVKFKEIAKIIRKHWEIL